LADDAFPNGLMNPLFFDPRATRGLSDFNVGQNFVVNLTWQPAGPTTGSRLTKWALGGFGNWAAYTKRRAASRLLRFLAEIRWGPSSTKPTSRPTSSLAAGCESVINAGNPNQYIKPKCFALPQATPAIASQCSPFGFRAPGSNGPADAGSPGIAGSCANLRGNLGRNTVIGPGTSNLDFSLFKNNRIRAISENFNVQFRAEVFNVFNRANFSSPTDNRTVFGQDGSLTPGVGLITSTQTPSRQIQFALKLVF